MDKTGPVPVKPPSDSMPVEQLIQQRKEGQAAPPADACPVQMRARAPARRRLGESGPGTAGRTPEAPRSRSGVPGDSTCIR